MGTEARTGPTGIIRLLFAGLVVATGALLLGACNDGDGVSPGTTLFAREVSSPGLLPADRSLFAGGRIFSEASALNTPIAPDAAVHPQSDELIATLIERMDRDAEIVIATTEWTVSAYLAAADTPRYDVRLTAEWSPYERLLDVPIPDAAAPDPEDDGSMTIIDLDNGWAYDFWQAKRTADGWQASWGNRLALDGDGVFPSGLSARGSGFSLLAGLIWPHELAQGRIDHALFFSFLPNRAGIVVGPATESDARSNDPLTLPEGAHLQLDPDLDLDALNLAPWVRVIARAMQEYGLILGDNGSESIGLEFVHPQSFGGLTVPYTIWDGVGIVDGIPVDRLRVLDWGDETRLDSLPNEVADASIFAGPRDD